MKRVGGCLCGAVRYETSAEPAFQGICHCRDCQRTSGSAYIPAFFVPENMLAVTGEVHSYTSRGASGSDITRSFCPRCGSQLFARPAVLGGLIGVRAGTLDDTAMFRPQIEIFASNAAPWHQPNPDTTKFAESPPPK